MTDEDARYHAKGMTDLQRRLIMLCSKSSSYQYLRLSQMLGVSYAEAKLAGDYLKAMNAAVIRPTSMGGEFSGSGIILNDRGEQVKAAVAKLMTGKKCFK